MKFLYIVLLTTVPLFSGIAQTSIDSTPHFVFLPPGLHFAPLKAHIEEPRIGVFKFLDASNMKVDIGNTIDVFGFNFPSSSMRITAGIDFMAYAFVTGTQGLRLQIDAIDGFFGGNVSVSKKFNHEHLQARLRILHHSAHLVDGHYIQSTQSWLDNRAPIAFTKDYGELIIAHVSAPSFGIVRSYAGIGYATLVRPSAVQRFAYLGGIECALNNLVGPLFQHPSNVFCAYNISLTGTPAYAATHQLQAGIKFGEWFEKGVTLYLAYYNGRHMFAEYFDERQTTIGIGFTVDFF